MSDINFRIKILRDHFAKGNNSDFASMIDSNEANIRNYIKETEPRANILVNICEKLEVSAEWLLLGKGDMLISKNSIENEESIEFGLKSNFELSPEILKFLEDYKSAFNAIQTIQDRKIEILSKNVRSLNMELNALKTAKDN
ncbi:helix-turn-helix transcriptional regulator [Chryseobacterium sp. PCH239]|uniref:helix-turn-helix domain-containing protein n=1 Tax=Chryseobacterium sp. PCH239 TaxID=2825845 RepID=UPI001C11EAD9|nr:helix-turn-helix domain-containing protein [Chryseobacterium sp. PCH239]QWT88158.1 helix-turn-helix transcriptional regulator [Chryseobacterium sp. PCH239]